MFDREQSGKALRQLLRLPGPSDQRVIEEAALLEEAEHAMARGHGKKLNEIGAKLAANAKSIAAARAELREAMAEAAEHAERTEPSSRVARLLHAFETCALVQVVALDDFGDEAIADLAVEHKHRLVATLDQTAPEGRAVLARLLYSPLAAVRASAGAHLLNAGLMHAETVPILQEIERRVASSAGWTAFWALAPDHHGDWLTGAPDRAP